MTALLEDVLASILFLTRIPATWLGTPSAGPPSFGRAAWAFPLVGALVGCAGGLVIVLAGWFNIPSPVTAILAVATTFALTGGLHEDGLADTADGFRGGRSAAQKLEIMRDSRVGTYGAAALVFAILLRAASLAALFTASPIAAALALIGAEATSRACMVVMWWGLPPAAGGLSTVAGTPSRPTVVAGVLLAAAVTVATTPLKLGFDALAAETLMSAAATCAFMMIAYRQIGGRTGDTLGACQQIAVTAFLLGAAAAA